MAFQFLFSRPERDFNRQEIVAMDDEDSAFEDANTQTTTPLSAIAEAFEELSQSVNVYNNKNNIRTDGLRLKPFCDACSLVSVLFGCLGIAFKFAEYEYCSKKIHGIYRLQWSLLQPSSIKNQVGGCWELNMIEVPTLFGLDQHLAVLNALGRAWRQQ